MALNVVDHGPCYYGSRSVQSLSGSKHSIICMLEHLQCLTFCVSYLVSPTFVLLVLLRLAWTMSEDERQWRRQPSSFAIVDAPYHASIYMNTPYPNPLPRFCLTQAAGRRVRAGTCHGGLSISRTDAVYARHPTSVNITVTRPLSMHCDQCDTMARPQTLQLRQWRPAICHRAQ
jgi:hypothetical protein